MTVCFFGHRDTPNDIKALLKETIIDLITNENATLFYVGNQGNFDRMAFKVLEELKEQYPHIRYYIVLAYLPLKSNSFNYDNFDLTIYPEGLEKVPPRFAISKRNFWLIEHSDTVVTYVTFSVGGAIQFKKAAERKGKKVLNLPDLI